MAALQPAAACGYHGTIGNYLSVMHPSSLTVAVALRRAAEAGTVDLLDLDAAIHRPGMYLGAVRELQAFGSALATVAGDSDSGLTFSLGLVESGLWTRYEVTDGKVTVDLHNDGPHDDEAVLLTGEPVLADILNGSLSVERALANGLVLIEGKDDEQATIYRALARAPLQAKLDGRQLAATVNNATENTEQRQ